MTRRGLILFAVMAVIWGIPYLFIRVAVEEISPAALVFARTGLGAAILLPIALLRTDYRAVLARWRWVSAFAVVEVGIPWILLGTAEQHITSSLAGLLVAGVPLVATVVAVVSGGRDRIGGTGAVGLLVGLVGVAAIVGVNLGSSSWAALLAMTLVVTGYATGPAIMSRRLAGVSNVSVIAFSLTLCALVYAPVAILQRPATLPSANVIGAVLILGVVCTAAAFLLFWKLIDETGPVRATVITYLNPAVAAVMGIAVLNESFTPVMGLGFGLVILGSVLATRSAGARSSDGDNERRRAGGPGRLAQIKVMHGAADIRQ
jgi:drug/metabolite transporter (DMT)-like permease